MAQVGFGHCVQKKRHPDISAPDLGAYTVQDPPMCLSNGDRAPRRRDLNRPEWGRSGVPTQDMISDNGIGVPDKRPLQVCYTEQGPVRLPFGDFSFKGFMPNSALLNALPYADTRRTAISNRYFR